MQKGFRGLGVSGFGDFSAFGVFRAEAEQDADQSLTKGPFRR